jgi:hypothetical protein
MYIYTYMHIGSSRYFGYMAVETQAIKYLNNDEIKILNKKENLFKESLDDYNKEKERLEQDSLLGIKKTTKITDVKIMEPKRVLDPIGQSSAQYSPGRQIYENTNSKMFLFYALHMCTTKQMHLYIYTYICM